MTLKDWAEKRWLTAYQVSPEEIADLLAVIDRDLVDAAVDGLSADWRLNIAYNAALQLAMLALAAEGFRPERQRAHERAIQALHLTIGADAAFVDTLDGIRRKRNRANYERAGTGSTKAHSLPTSINAPLTPDQCKISPSAFSREPNAIRSCSIVTALPTYRRSDRKLGHADPANPPILPALALAPHCWAFRQHRLLVRLRRRAFE